MSKPIRQPNPERPKVGDYVRWWWRFRGGRQKADTFEQADADHRGYGRVTGVSMLGEYPQILFIDELTRERSLLWPSHIEKMDDDEVVAYLLS